MTEDYMIASKGAWALYQGEAPEPFFGESVDSIRKRMAMDFFMVLNTKDRSGVWGAFHPPGTGKTTTFGMMVKECTDVPVIICAPNVAEANAIAERTGLMVLRRQDPTTCRQLADEDQLPEESKRLSRHLSAGHKGSIFCSGCKYQDACKQTPGQYRHDQWRFSQHINGRGARVVMTVSMLATKAFLVNSARMRHVIWTDEDLFPHLAKLPGESEKDGPVPNAKILEWIEHARLVAGAIDGAIGPHIAFMEGVADLLSKARPDKESDTVEAHSTPDGWAVTPDSKEVKPLLDMVASWEGGTHPSEQLASDGSMLPLGNWRVSIFTRVVDLLRGRPWIQINRRDHRFLTGAVINREMLKLPTKHALVQSDATASEDLWKSVWGSMWRTAFTGQPIRAVRVNWIAESVPKNDGGLAVAVHRLKRVLTKITGKVGVLTHKAWEDAMADAVPYAQSLTACEILGHDVPSSKRVIIGHFGKHDRATNAFHQQGVEHLFIIGSFRPPMSHWHQRTGAFLAMGATAPLLPDSVQRFKAIPTPQGFDGRYYVQDGHRASHTTDVRTNWMIRHERGSQLAQALERVRSVERADKGLPPALVYLWGQEAADPRLPGIDYQFYDPV